MAHPPGRPTLSAGPGTPAGVPIPGEFHLIDLISQAPAVQRRLAGLAEADKLAWLAARGSLEPLPEIRDGPDGPLRHLFESRLGFRCAFFLQGDAIVFLGDNTTFVVRERPDRGGSAVARPPRRGRVAAFVDALLRAWSRGR